MKVVERIFEHRIQQQIEVDDMQIGFMKGKGATDAIFTARRNARIASSVLATGILSVHPSVCPSHAGIVSKRRHVARCSLHCWIAKCV